MIRSVASRLAHPSFLHFAQSVARLLAAIGLSVAASVAAAQAWPLLAVPRGAIVADLGDEIRIDGHATRIQHLILQQSASETIAHYRGVLGPQSVTRTLGAMTTLAARRGAYFITIRISSSAGVTRDVFVMTTRLEAQPRAAAVTSAPDLPLPAGSQIINVTEAVDSGRWSRTVVALHPVAIDAAADAIERALRERGFARVTGENRAASSGSKARRRSFFYQRDGAEIFVTVTERERVGLIVYNFVQEK